LFGGVSLEIDGAFLNFVVGAGQESKKAQAETVSLTVNLWKAKTTPRG
jgi:hypothetical protein